MWIVLQDGETALHSASSNGHIELAKLLIDRGADIHAKNNVSGYAL